MPLIVVANSPDKEAALAGLERWKAKHASVAALLAVDDVSDRLDAGPFFDLDPHSRQFETRSRVDAAGAGDARSRRRPHA